MRAVAWRVRRKCTGNCDKSSACVRSKRSTPPREFSHQPAVFFPKIGKVRALLATPPRKVGRGHVIQSVEKVAPLPIQAEVSQHFGAALHDAVTTSIASMDELHERLTPCVKFLRASNVGPVQMILSIKACARDHAKAMQARGHEFAVSQVNMLMEQIVKWAIIEYYSSD